MTFPVVLLNMAKQSKKNKSKTLVISSKQSSEEVKNLFKNNAKELGNRFLDENGQWITVHPKGKAVLITEPKFEMYWLDEDGFPMKTGDEIRAFNKRMYNLDKEEFLANKKGTKSKRKRKNLPDAQFELDIWDDLLVTSRDGSEWVVFTKMYDGKPAINEKFTLSYRQLGFNEPSIEFLRICATSNNTASFPYGKRKVKSRIDITFRDLFRKDEEMSIVSHPNKKAHYYPLFKINHLDKDGNSIYGHTFGNEFAQLEEKK